MAETIVVFVNTKSGGQVGAKLVKPFQSAGLMVCDIMVKAPEVWLAELSSKKENVRILIAGGDGTVRWVLQAMEKAVVEFPIAILPLGTGNDFARVTNWGAGYAGQASSSKRIQNLINQVNGGVVRNFDCWNLNTKVSGSDESNKMTMINYFSVGVDAKAAHRFHSLRERHPKLFKSRFTNQAIYGWYGFAIATDCSPMIANTYKVTVDGKPIKIPSNSMSLIVLNVSSFAAGVNLWGKPNPKNKQNFSETQPDDGLLELVSVRSTLHVGLIKIHLARATRIAQGREVKITSIAEHPKKLAYQVDGEPWLNAPLDITIELEKKVPVVFKSKK
eukprot:c12698_g1_i1.p1 GENE.c12698_g1_i1~~c12698_g1_i1.p1  ORF type:complete len:343 (+),score=76.30 c12698_g1_i1:34-1029(+)